MTCIVQLHNSRLLQPWVILTGTPWWEPQQKMHGLPDGYEVLQRLGHLEAFYGEVASVKEVVDPLLAAAGVIVGLCLGQLIVMVGKT